MKWWHAEKYLLDQLYLLYRPLSFNTGLLTMLQFADVVGLEILV